MKLRFSYFLVFLPFIFNAQNKAVDLMKAFISKVERVNTATYTLSFKERMGDKYVFSKADVKYQKHPFKMYLKQHSPKKGLEVLYNNEFSSKAYINPQGFPWVTLNLSPFSSQMRADGHHTIFETGYTYFSKMAAHILSNQQAQFDFQYLGTVNQSGKSLDKIKLLCKDYITNDYEVKQGESLRKIAQKHFVSEYSIVECNSEITGFNSKLQSGQKIKIPNVYAKSIEILIDPSSKLPVEIKIHDTKGLFELYNFENAKVNPVFKAATFDPENSLYGF